MEEGTCFTTADWKMKFMAFQFREMQTEFFGKRGIPWHGMMIAYKEGNDLRIEFQDCIVRDSKEDAQSVFQQMAVGWKAFLIRHPEQNKTHVRTDGASCYSGVHFCKLLAFCKDLCGMTVLSHLIGEGGKNKTTLDGHFGTRGTMLRREVIQGVGKTDAVTPEAVASLLANDRCGGSYAQLVTTNRTEFNLLGVEDVAGIGHMAERVYEYADEGAFSGVRFRQQTALGLGRFVSAAELLGATVVGDVPLAMEHEVVNQVSKLLSVGFTDSQKSAAVAAAAVKRAALEARKRLARTPSPRARRLGASRRLRSKCAAFQMAAMNTAAAVFLASLRFSSTSG